MQRLITAQKKGQLEEAIRSCRQETITNFSHLVLNEDLNIDDLKIICNKLKKKNHVRIITDRSFGETREITTDKFKENLSLLLSLPEFQPNFNLDHYIGFDYFTLLLDDPRFYTNSIIEILSLLLRVNVPDRIESYLNTDKCENVTLSTDFIEQHKLYKYSLSLILGHDKITPPTINNKFELCSDAYIKISLKKKIPDMVQKMEDKQVISETKRRTYLFMMGMNKHIFYIICCILKEMKRIFLDCENLTKHQVNREIINKIEKSTNIELEIKRYKYTDFVGLKLPSSLIRFNCFYNQITSFVGLILPSSLEYFGCSNNQITSFAGLTIPESLTVFGFYDDQITKFQDFSFPSELIILTLNYEVKLINPKFNSVIKYKLANEVEIDEFNNLDRGNLVFLYLNFVLDYSVSNRILMLLSKRN
jgi:hypothetical protein